MSNLMIKGDLRMVPRAPRAPPRSQYQYHIPIRAVALPWATATTQTSISFLPSHPVEESLKYGLLTSQIHCTDGLGASVYWTLSSTLCSVKRQKEKTWRSVYQSQNPCCLGELPCLASSSLRFPIS